MDRTKKEILSANLMNSRGGQPKRGYQTPIRTHIFRTTFLKVKNAFSALANYFKLFFNKLYFLYPLI